MNGRDLTAASCVLIATAAILAGCEGSLLPDSSQKALADAQQELRRVKDTNEDLTAAVAEQKHQISTLQALGEKRLEKLFYVERIELGRFTGGIDLDGQEGHDAIKVYLKPIDQHGSVLKAAGEVTVALYDLAEDAKDNLIGKCHWSVEELADQWSGSFMSYHYGLTCRFQQGTPRHDEITVRVAFTDYLTGKACTAQKLCKTALPTTQPGK